MSETEAEYETHPAESQANSSTGISFRKGLEPSELDAHLLRKEDDRSVSSQTHTVKSAVQTLSQAISESDLEKDDLLNFQLARAAQTISNFLKVAHLTISTEEDYNLLPDWMRRDLIGCLDMILSERFLNALFLLRQHIRHLAIKRERIVSTQMVTLSDVVIAAIIDYASDTPQGKRKITDGAEVQTIELAVRLPQRIDSLAIFIKTPIFGEDPDLNLQVKLGALAILYCSRCLNPIRQLSEKTLADSISSFCLCAQLKNIPGLAIAHLLCVYISSCVDFKDEIHPFKPATNAALWTLLIQLFPETGLFSKEALDSGQKAFFSHGALLMPWIWWNSSLCPAQDINWVRVITLLWIRQEYSWLGLNSSTHGLFLSNSSQFGCLEEASNYSRVVDVLLENHAIGFKHLLGVNRDQHSSEQSGIEKCFPNYTMLAVLQVYSAVCNLPKTELSTEEKDEICAQIEKFLQVEIDRSFEGSAGLEILNMILSLPQKVFDRMMKSLQIRFHWMLESLLLEIEISADPTYRQEENLSHQKRALSKLEFLTKCVESQPLIKEHLVKSSVFNLVNTLLTPLRCHHTIALAITKLTLCISKSANVGYALNHQQMRTVSEALIEVMTVGHEASTKRRRRGEGVMAGLATADFVKEYGSQFDYQMNYPLGIYTALREELADELWIHLATLPQAEPTLSSDGSNKTSNHTRSAPEKHHGISIAEGMDILFERFSELQRKYIRASPLARELLIYLKSSPEEVLQNMIHML
ncbi:hypothetical protein PGT21_001672 [Puccinia graminis f. sp. tritici]|uniref:Uncharacterized protein n=1 Tax=Puccinia graminis f. sp. tritici TaxID=56615 RepID=A0A5B0QS83_PUCGR|nr:hypothetical protein PGT21_001672 [Puccinia graminis f. sp. tritici]